RVVKERRDAAQGEWLDFTSNDYLGLAEHPEVVGALRAARRVGSGGSRLLAGAHAEHAALERELAEYVGRERALLFASGYHAALGAIGALAKVVGSAYFDALNHACLIDGLRGTRLPRHIYRHLAFAGAARGADRGSGALVVSESIFGMDGDAADPRALLAALGPDDVLLIDEAHALGVEGTHGAGLAYGVDDPRVLVLGTLSKAFGAHGGFVAGPAIVIDYLQTAARTFIFDTALPPSIAEAARAGLRVACGSDAARAHLAALGDRLRRGLRSLGYAVGEGRGPVVPVLVGGEEPVLALAAALRERDIDAPPIRPPTVPPGACRLRVTLRATHSMADVDRLLEALADR
ncbi:MAG: aminotransferase class I/II-fold pyridoxal phosphate-dependent enzyme, partial [bacterium]|nr:aminotransferase class I/II-fold pyridoxal phosphate-dependent enzyme [bacterium]